MGLQSAESYYDDIQNNKIIIDGIIVSGGILITKGEALNICKLVKETSSIEGNIIEVGAFTGGTSKMIQRVKNPNKMLYIIDTFEGLVDANHKIDGVSNHTIISSYDTIVTRFKDEHNIEIVRGYFPQDMKDKFKDEKFSFVHLDVDTFKSTLNSLKFLYNKTIKGGVILTHDYTLLKGVKKAFDFFFRNKKEKIKTLCDTQAWIIKE